MAPSATPALVTLQQRRHKLLAGQAGLALLAMTAATAAGLSPLLPLLVAGAVYGSARFSPLQGLQEKRLLKLLGKAHLPLEPGDPVYERAAALAQKMNLPAPKIYLMAPRFGSYNVGALSPIHRKAPREGALLVPSSLYDSTLPGRPPVFTPAEQEAVIAHELSHLLHHDSRRMTLLSGLNSSFLFSAAVAAFGCIVGVVAAPALWACAGLAVAGQLLEKYCHRQMEYRTDASAVAHTGDPEALATALEKLSRISRQIHAFTQNARDITEIEAPHIYGVMFKPLKKRVEPGNEDSAFLARLLSTHPDFDSRYDNIRAVGAELGVALPATRPSVAMDDVLPESRDGIVLPPFAIPEAIRYNETHNSVSILTCIHDFNKAAQAGAPRQTPRHFPPKRPIRGLRF